MSKKELKIYTCTLDIGKVYPTRKAYSKEEFIENLLEEYNSQCYGLFDIWRNDIKNVRCDLWRMKGDDDE